MDRPLIYIINSSTFGKHFPEHIKTLEFFADLDRIDVPADIDGGALGEIIKDADGIIASVTPKFTRETLEQCKNSFFFPVMVVDVIMWMWKLHLRLAFRCRASRVMWSVKELRNMRFLY